MTKPEFANSDKLRFHVLLCVVCCILFSQNVYADSGNVYRYCENNDNMIALTFDDGPHGVYTPQILDILSEYGIPATFFVIGSNGERHPELLKRIIDEGHEIGNHTFTHDRPWKLSRKALIDELTHTENVIHDACGLSPSLFRPPEGVASENVVAAAARLNYNVILWTVDPRDWEKTTTAQSVIDCILTNVKSGSIILCHDGVSRDDSVTPEAIAAIIPALLEQGYNFVTVSELIGQ